MTVNLSARRPTPFHRLVRLSPQYRWWRLPVAGLVAVLLFLVCAVVGFGVLDRVEPGFLATVDPASLDISVRSDPAFLVVAYLSVALLLPCLRLGLAVVGQRPVGVLSSVAGRLRWSWLGRAFAVSAVVTVVALLIDTMAVERTPVESPDRRALVGLAVMLALTPFQAAAEEYLFRGYLMQLVGSWFRSPVLAVAVNVALFTLGHEYGGWGLVDVAVFGAVASALTLATGGLEAGIALHIANNAALAVFEAFGLVDAGGSDSSPGLMDVLPSVATSLVIAVVLAAMFRRRELALANDTD